MGPAGSARPLHTVLPGQVKDPVEVVAEAEEEEDPTPPRNEGKRTGSPRLDSGRGRRIRSSISKVGCRGWNKRLLCSRGK